MGSAAHASISVSVSGMSLKPVTLISGSGISSDAISALKAFLTM
jgi:hypothetical protein